MLKNCAILALAFVLSVVSIRADAQQLALQCRHGQIQCADRCGVIVVRTPSGEIETATEPVCAARCQLCPMTKSSDSGPPVCPLRYDCIQIMCRVTVDPSNPRVATVDPQCVSDCPPCNIR